MNTEAAEVLYQCVGDLAELSDTSTLVDVCCGTGTIGLCLASRVKKVAKLLVLMVDFLLNIALLEYLKYSKLNNRWLEIMAVHFKLIQDIRY